MSPKHVEALRRAVTKSNVQAAVIVIEHLRGDLLSLVGAQVFEKGRRTSSGLCRGRVLLFLPGEVHTKRDAQGRDVQEFEWQHQPQADSEYVLLRLAPATSCSAAAVSAERTIVTRKIGDKDLLDIVAAFRTARVSKRSGDLPGNAHLESRNVITSIALEDDRAEVTTQGKKGAKQRLVLIKHGGEWGILFVNDQ